MARALLFIAAVGCTDYSVAPIADPSASNWFDEASADMREELGPEGDNADTGWAVDTGFSEEDEPSNIDPEDESEDESDVEGADVEDDGPDDETDDSDDGDYWEDDGSDSWSDDDDGDYGGADGPTSVRSPSVGEMVVTELMIHPEATDDAVGEWVEIRNVSGDWLSLAGHRLGDRGVDDVVVSPVSAGSLVVGPGEFLTICAEDDYWDNGGVYCDGTFDYATFGGGFALSNTEDEVQVLSSTGMLIDEVRYGEGFSVEGEAQGLRPELASASDNDRSDNWCGQTTFLPFGDEGTPGGQNDHCW
jgi:hypothetical protein